MTRMRSGESEFYAREAGCTDGLHVEAILNNLGMRATINLRCDAKPARALAQTRFAQENTARESEVLVRTRPRKSRRSRSAASTDRNEPGRHRGETLAESQIRIPQESSENAMTSSRLWRARRRIRRELRRRSDDVDETRVYGNSWTLQTRQDKAVGMRQETSRERRASPQRDKTKTCEPSEMHWYE